jgi:hypothetical protein
LRRKDYNIKSIENNKEKFPICLNLITFAQTRFVMAVYVKAIPTLRGAVAERFVQKSEDNLRRRATVNFSKEAANSKAILMKRSASK